MQSSTWSYLGPGEDVNGIISLGIRWIQGASWAKVARFANLAAQQLTLAMAVLVESKGWFPW